MLCRVVIAEPMVPSWFIRRGKPRCPKAHQLTAPLRASALVIAAVLLPRSIALTVPPGVFVGGAGTASVACCELSCRSCGGHSLRRPALDHAENGQGTTAVSTPSHERTGCVCGGVDGRRKAGVDAAIGQGWLAYSTRDEHDGQGLEKILRQPVVLSVFWSRQVCGPCGMIAPRESSDEGRSFLRIHF